MGKSGWDRYNADLVRGLEYEDFVSDFLWRRAGIGFARHVSPKTQCTYGENTAGIEIKLDDKYADTGNLFVETRERETESHDWKPAGVMRDDCTFLAIGDYTTLFLFGARHLREFCRNFPRVVNATNTGEGFLLLGCERHPERFAIKVFDLC